MRLEKARSMQRWVEDPGWRARVGFISTPRFSLDPMEFLRIAPEGFAVCQHMTYTMKNGVPAKFDYRMKSIAEAAKQLEEAALVLKSAEINLVAQSGTPFAFAREGGFNFTRDLQAKIEKDINLPFVMMGMAVVNALKTMGYNSLAVACTYYYDRQAEMYAQFLKDAGFKVLGMENWVSQGLIASQEEVFHGMVRRHPIGLVYKAAKIVSSHHPEADCVVISGGGVVTMDILQPLETDLRKPVISSLAALFWEIFRRLEVFEPLVGRGSLLANLKKGL